MMNCTCPPTINKPKRALHMHIKYWNRERYITVVVVFTTENEKNKKQKTKTKQNKQQQQQNIQLTLKIQGNSEGKIGN